MENWDFSLGRVREGSVFNLDLSTAATYDVSGRFFTFGVNVTGSVNDVGDGDARTLDLG